MEKHGLQVAEGSNADLIVAHLIIIQDNVSTTYNNQYFGYRSFSELVDLAHKKGMKNQYSEYVQKVGLVIDLIDAKTHKLVYRDYAVGGAMPNATEEERRVVISKAVAETLQRFFR